MFALKHINLICYLFSWDLISVIKSTGYVFMAPVIGPLILPSMALCMFSACSLPFVTTTTSSSSQYY